MKEIIEKIDPIKMKNFCPVKYNIKRIRGQATDWKKYFEMTHLIKDYYPKYTKNS